MLKDSNIGLSGEQTMGFCRFSKTTGTHKNWKAACVQVPQELNKRARTAGGATSLQLMGF